MKATLLDLSAWVDGYSNVTTDHGQDCEDWVHERRLSMDRTQTGAFPLRANLACASASWEHTLL